VDKQTRLARTILNGFAAYFAEFENITLAARTRFENAEWQLMHVASTRRIALYKALSKLAGPTACLCSISTSADSYPA